MGRRSASGPLSFLSWRESLAWLVANNDVSAAGLVWLKQRPERASGERAGCSADLGQHRGRSSTAEHQLSKPRQRVRFSPPPRPWPGVFLGEIWLRTGTPAVLTMAAVVRTTRRPSRSGARPSPDPGGAAPVT